MEALENIMSRHSVRKYKSDMVPQEKIDQIVEAGLWAPSGRGSQSSKIIVIKNKDFRNKLSKLNGEIMGLADGVDPFYGAPVVIIVLGDKSVPTYINDGSTAIENMLLAAHALGLGACWIHRARQEFESEEGKAFIKRLGLEGDYEGIGHCIIGYPDEDEAPKRAERKPGRVIYVK